MPTGLDSILDARRNARSNIPVRAHRCSAFVRRLHGAHGAASKRFAECAQWDHDHEYSCAAPGDLRLSLSHGKVQRPDLSVARLPQRDRRFSRTFESRTVANASPLEQIRTREKRALE